MSSAGFLAPYFQIVMSFIFIQNLTILSLSPALRIAFVRGWLSSFRTLLNVRQFLFSAVALQALSQFLDRVMDCANCKCAWN